VLRNQNAFAIATRWGSFGTPQTTSLNFVKSSGEEKWGGNGKIKGGHEGGPQE